MKVSCFEDLAAYAAFFNAGSKPDPVIVHPSFVPERGHLYRMLGNTGVNLGRVNGIQTSRRPVVYMESMSIPTSWERDPPATVSAPPIKTADELNITLQVYADDQEQIRGLMEIRFDAGYDRFRFIIRDEYSNHDMTLEIKNASVDFREIAQRHNGRISCDMAITSMDFTIERTNQ